MVAEFAFGISVLVLGFLLGFIFGGSYTMDALQERAIKANAAHYVCNQETGDCKFEFK